MAVASGARQPNFYTILANLCYQITYLSTQVFG
jgi:hypothetical protein